MTLGNLARMLRKSHRETRSWASTGEAFGISKAMAYRIANENYDPAAPQVRARLGLGPRTCPTCQQRVTVPKQVRTWRRLDDLKPAEVLYLLATRTEMQ